MTGSDQIIGIVAQMKETMEGDLEELTRSEAETKAALEDDVKFKASLESSCKTKQAEWDARSKIRAEEIAAISETIEILNGDDALDLFKKTMPSPADGPSVLQVSTKANAKARSALILRRLLERGSAHSVNLRMMPMMLKSHTHGGFDKIVAMV